MSGTVSTALKFAAGLFLVLALIGIAVNVFSPATDAAKIAQTDFSNTTTELKDQKYLVYDNTVISGSQVVNALRKFESEGKSQTLGLYVETGKNSNGAGTWYYSAFDKASDSMTASSTTDLSNTKEVTNAKYINPSGMFDAVVERDSNGVIRAIKFVQQ
ncbi:ABC transporter permease (plasmid) [Ureibacillus chungkukjangi]|uniref:ABC transporter permease n=1 Tax=Ureibacillus chungkukjangi TaxID=1202712 RepID=UPI000D3448C1|nr:ABC transporter permease [Ureibacillus chungkukjangi]MCM3390210.1 ABC transporter permease [Ureibacillus chungkukjangi]